MYRFSFSFSERIFTACRALAAWVVARYRGAAAEPIDWDADETSFMDDDTPPEIAAQHEARAREIRSDLLDDDTP